MGRLRIPSLAPTLRALAAAVLLQAQPGVIEYARTIRLPDGDFKHDTYEPARHPAQMCLLQALDAGATWVAVAKPVQDGGSLSTSAPILRRVAALHQTVMVAYPTQDKAKDAWSTKLWPMLEAQGGMQPERGGGSRGGAARVAQLPGGGKFLLRSSGGRSESGQAGDTADALQIEEVDDWSDLRRLKLIERRISKSADPLLIYVSTVKRDGEGAAGSHILRLVEYGTGTTLRYACPHCGGIQPFTWEQVDVAREVLRCQHCEHDITEADRQQALKHWHRHDARRSVRMFSITWTALDSPFPIVVNGTKQPVLAGLCAEYRQAADAVQLGDHSLMRQFYRDRLCRPYRVDLGDEDAPQVLTRLGLTSRSAASPLPPARSTREQDGDSDHVLPTLPHDTQFVTASCDVQRGGERAPGRLYWLALAWMADGRSAVAGWGSVRLCAPGAQPSTVQLHDGLDRLSARLDALGWPIVRRGVDVGDRQDEIVSWCKRNRDWLPHRGEDSEMKAHPGDIGGTIYFRRQEGGWKLGLIEVDTVRGAVHDALSVPVLEPGALLIPRGEDATGALVKHLVASARIPDKGSGYRWSKTAKDRPQHGEWQRRRDLLDCATYAWALGIWWRRKPTIQTIEPPAATAPAPAAGDWMGGWA